MRCWRYVSPLVMAMSLSIFPANSSAQACGGVCQPCGWTFYEGTGSGDTYYTGCVYGTQCDLCLSPQLEGEAPQAEAEVLAALVDARSEAVENVVDRYGPYLRVLPERRAIVTIGVGCEADRPGSIAFLTEAKVRELARLGVERLTLPNEPRSASGRSSNAIRPRQGA